MNLPRAEEQEQARRALVQLVRPRGGDGGQAAGGDAGAGGGELEAGAASGRPAAGGGGAGVPAFIASQRASRSAELATSRELANAATNNLGIDPERSALLALQALKTADTLDARNALHQALPELHVLRSFVAHDLAVSAVTYNPDGELLARGSLRDRIRIWEADTGRLVKVLPGHSVAVAGLGSSGDGALLASVGSELVTKVWDVQAGLEVASLYGHTGRVQGVAFSPDVTQVATGADDGTVRLYTVSVDELVALAGSCLTRSLATEERQRYLHVEESPVGL